MVDVMLDAVEQDDAPRRSQVGELAEDLNMDTFTINYDINAVATAKHES